jgi:hypothetical protein
VGCPRTSPPLSQPQVSPDWARLPARTAGADLFGLSFLDWRSAYWGSPEAEGSFRDLGLPPGSGFSGTALGWLASSVSISIPELSTLGRLTGGGFPAGPTRGNGNGYRLAEAAREPNIRLVLSRTFIKVD